MELRGAKVAVTGATGFLGRYIVDVLLERGAHVIGVVRNPDRVPELVRRGVELRRADLAAPERLVEGFRGADAVVSNAALISLRNFNWRDHDRSNVEGTKNVFSSIVRAGVRRVVQVSSVAVYDGRKQPVIDETHPLLNDHSRRWPWMVYRISKAASERFAWELARADGLELTTVRPCGIYGAFDANFTAIYRILVGSKICFTPLFARLPLVYAGDVAEAIARALERPRSIGKAYNVTGDFYELRPFVAAWREAGGPAGRIRLPLPLPFSFNPPYDNRLAKEDLDWRNRPYVDALRETFALEERAVMG